jgi:chloride channel protein, CIC family
MPSVSPSRASSRSGPRLAARLGNRLGRAGQQAWTTIRVLVRADEVWLAFLVATVGALAGLGVAGMNGFTAILHSRLFALPPGQGLSESPHVAPLRAIVVPTLGGIVLGVFAFLLARFRPGGIVDPVEANALYGGRMSFRDSVIVAAQTVWSNGIGGSVGLEAGYAQLGSGAASRLGRLLRLRRSDMRLMVGCGAAAAIAGAFSAPLCGAFYGIELVIGTYSIATLPFVIIASLSGTLVVNLLHAGSAPLTVVLPQVIPLAAYPVMIVLGILSGFAAIAIMRSVTAIEAGFRTSGIPLWLRPLLGGLVVGVLGSLTPSAFSSGHSALHADIGLASPFLVVLLLFLAKAIASAFSIGAGFRGGLFFASLFLGSLFGKVFADAIAWLPFLPPLPIGFYAVVGMSAMAVAIVGGPMTMTFLALESTDNFTITIAVLAAAIAAAITVRRVFGYSFTTWRFHLRGEAIRSAVDIGWIHSLTVGRMMRRSVATVQSSMAIAAFREEVPLGASQRVIVLDDDDRYAGIIYPAEAHAADTSATHVRDILHHQDHVLLPQMIVKEAIAAFEQAEADALAVVDGIDSRRVLGLLTEQYALRRYSEELDRRRRELAGE